MVFTKKTSKIEQPKGMYSQLPERITEFYNMVVAKGELITVEDIMPFVPKQSLSRDSEEETKANIKSKLDFSAERVEVDLLTKFNLDMKFKNFIFVIDIQTKHKPIYGIFRF